MAKKEITIKKKLDLILDSIKEKKGKQIVSINLARVENSVSNYFVICHGESTTQVSAIADWVEANLKNQAGVKPHHIEGTDNNQWVLLDYFDILVHVFLEEKRTFFNLEELWADGEIDLIDDK